MKNRRIFLFWKLWNADVRDSASWQAFYWSRRSRLDRLLRREDVFVKMESVRLSEWFHKNIGCGQNLYKILAFVPKSW